MASTTTDRVIGLALSNPKFRKQLLDSNIDNKELLKKYGIKPTPDLLKLDKDKLADVLKSKLDQVAWCIGNACGKGA